MNSLWFLKDLLLIFNKKQFWVSNLGRCHRSYRKSSQWSKCQGHWNSSCPVLEWISICSKDDCGQFWNDWKNCKRSSEKVRTNFVRSLPDSKQHELVSRYGQPTKTGSDSVWPWNYNSRKTSEVWYLINIAQYERLSLILCV